MVDRMDNGDDEKKKTKDGKENGGAEGNGGKGPDERPNGGDNTHITTQSGTAPAGLDAFHRKTTFLLAE